MVFYNFTRFRRINYKNMEGPIHLSLHKTFISFRMLWKRSRKQSLADVQLRNDGTIALDVLLGQVVEQAAALTDHLVHAKTAVVVIGMTLQMLGELKDALGKNGDLDFGRTGVVLVGGVLADDFGLFLFGDHGGVSFLYDSVLRRGNGRKGNRSGGMTP